MANRFLDTNYYKSPFVRSLPGKLKSLYSFIICDCDGSGIWRMDMQAASLYIGFEVTQKEFELSFTAKGKAINLGGDKFFFPDFIEHQYPNGLQANNKAHKNFISALKKFGLIDENLKVTVKPLESPLKGSPEGFPSIGIGIGIGNGKGNGLGTGHVEGGLEGDIPDQKYIVPQMCELWYTNFPVYTKDSEKDKDGMGKVLQFIHKQSPESKNVGDPVTQEKILNTLQLIADQVNRTPFWVNRPIKSIANNIQLFYNDIKNPINGSQQQSGTGKSSSRYSITAERNKRRAEREQAGNK